jgi:hypothetical protein
LSLFSVAESVSDRQWPGTPSSADQKLVWFLMELSLFLNVLRARRSSVQRAENHMQIPTEWGDNRLTFFTEKVDA